MGAWVADLFLDSSDTRAFLAPRHVLQGDGSSRAVGAALKGLVSSGTAFVVADEAVGKYRLADDLLASIVEAGLSSVFAAPVAGEPTVDDARKAVAAARSAEPVAIVGIGGGSAIDLAKVVALAVPNDGEIEAFFGAADTRLARLPLAAVPTTVGTGAEVTRIAMLRSAGRKIIISTPAIVPDIVAIDPRLAMSLPPAVAAATGLDALCHAVESLLSANRSPSSVALSAQALRLVAGSLKRAFDDATDLSARRALMYGAHFAGLGLNAGVVLGHSIGYTLATRAPIAHGVSCAMALPYCLRYALPAARDVVEGIAEIAIGRRDVDHFISWIFELNRALGVPPDLASAGIDAGAPPDLAAECIELYPRPNNPAPLEQGRLTALYEAMSAADAATGPI